MCTFVLAVSALFVVSVVSAEPIEVTKNGLPVVYNYRQGDACPAKDFYYDCNLCFCLADGKSAACSLMLCPNTREKRETRDQLPRNDLFGLTGQCNPNEAFLDVCNICHCNPDGKAAACTLMACESQVHPRLDGYQQGQKCVAGKTFYNECNACLCGANGDSAVCTLMKCANSRSRRSVAAEQSEVPKIYNYKQGDKCPAKHFLDDCNACICNDDGVSALCTLAVCPTRAPTRPSYPHIDNFEEVGECSPGQVFYDKCNRCKCGPNGKSAACTLMGCPPVEKLRIDGYVNGKKCPAGKTFYNRCNACNCGTDGRSALCTFVACPEFES